MKKWYYMSAEDKTCIVPSSNVPYTITCVGSANYPLLYRTSTPTFLFRSPVTPLPARFGDVSGPTILPKLSMKLILTV